MKSLLLILGLFFWNAEPVWLTDFEQAKKIAIEKKQNILLNFSGSDWCGPCMRMKKEVFASEEFKNYASEHLVLINADFPRNKKNSLSKEQQAKNDKLADVYNSGGKFPLTILLSPDGKVMKEWEGFPSGTPNEFVQQLIAAGGAGNTN